VSSKRGKYSPEFREAAVREVIDKSRPIAERLSRVPWNFGGGLLTIRLR
jgi:transposase-like protein